MKPEEFRNVILSGSIQQNAALIPSGIVQTIVTSPPYFGHREYSKAGDPDEIGREKTQDEYIANLVSAFAALRHTLRDDGTLWLNLGDTYRKGELLGIPWKVAFALQADGWRLRSDVIWHKPNAMPSSVKTRPTTDHEYIFLFAKSEKYFYDADAIREPHVTFSENSKMKGGRNHFGIAGGTPEKGKNSGNSNLHSANWDKAFHPKGRNKRTVWSISLGKNRDAHFAVFPPKLIEPCVFSSSAEGDLVLDPFMGSGTTAIVAATNGRDYLGIELEPEFKKIAEKRIKEATAQPTL